MSTNKSGTNAEVRFNVRVPEGLHQRLVQRAAANGRSMNSEIIDMLEQCFGDPDENEIRRLAFEGNEILRDITHSQRHVNSAEMRLKMIRRELRRHIGDRVGDEDPVEFVLKEIAKNYRAEKEARKGG